MSDTDNTVDSKEPRPEEVGTEGSAPESNREEEEAQISPQEKEAVVIASIEPTREEKERLKRK